jgi:glycosyltransferase involved in cell wall biosynthesis
MNYRIIFVHGNSNLIAGQELSLVSRIRGLSNLGEYSEVILPEKGIFSNFLQDAGITVNFIPLNRLSKKNPFPFIRTILSIFLYIKKNKISLIHCSGVYPTQYCLPAAKLARIPCITHVNSTIYTKYDLKSSFIEYSDTVITVSEAVKKNIEELTNHKHSNCFALFKAIAKRGQFRNPFMLYDAIHQDQNNMEGTNSLKEKFKISSDTKIVGQIGQIIPRKGIESFIMMAKIIKQSYPKVKFMLIGDSPTGYEQYNEKMQKLVNDSCLKDDVIFTGFQYDIRSFLEILNIHVLASLVEGLPRVVIEAMLMAKPNVCTDIEGTNEVIVNGYSGLLVPPSNPELLANAVLELLLDETKAKLMGERGKKSVSDKFNERRHAEQLLKIYGIVLNKRLKLERPEVAIK